VGSFPFAVAGRCGAPLLGGARYQRPERGRCDLRRARRGGSL